jgi:hypothetical protein
LQIPSVFQSRGEVRGLDELSKEAIDQMGARSSAEMSVGRLEVKLDIISGGGDSSDDFTREEL